MNDLSDDLLLMIINDLSIKLDCIFVCKKWIELLNDNVDIYNLDKSVELKDYYSINYTLTIFPDFLTEKLITDDVILLKIIGMLISNINNKILIDEFLDKIMEVEDYNLFEFLLNLENNIFLSKDNYIRTRKFMQTAKILCKFKYIDMLLSRNPNIADDDIKTVFNFDENYFHTGTLYNPLYLSYYCNNDLNNIENGFGFKYHKSLNELLGVEIKEVEMLNAYFECIRHGYYGIINRNEGFSKIYTAFLDKKYNILLFILSLSGSAKIDDILRYVDFDHNDKKFNDVIDEMNLRDKYNLICKTYKIEKNETRCIIS